MRWAHFASVSVTVLFSPSWAPAPTHTPGTRQRRTKQPPPFPEQRKAELCARQVSDGAVGRLLRQVELVSLRGLSPCSLAARPPRCLVSRTFASGFHPETAAFLGTPALQHARPPDMFEAPTCRKDVLKTVSLRAFLKWKNLGRFLPVTSVWKMIALGNLRREENIVAGRKLGPCLHGSQMC